jgi:outer membrane protein
MSDCLKRGGAGRRCRVGALFASAVALAGCSSVGPRGLAAPTPDSPAHEVRLPRAAPTAAPQQPTLPEELFTPGATVTLAKVVEIALLNNPATRASYFQARSAAALVGSKKAPYYPSVTGFATYNRSKNSSQDLIANTTEEIYGPSVTLNYLLLDLGGRAANVQDAQLGLIAADWGHNATIQNVVLDVETTYVGYLDARAQLDAARVTVKQAQTTLDAATTRHDAGVATIAEVLQAKTARSQAEFALQSTEGEVFALRGALATAMGLPANTPYDVGTLSNEVPLDRASDAVEQLIATAKTNRPDLEAMRALAAKGTAHIKAVRSDGLPNLSLNANAGRSYFNFNPVPGSSSIDSWSATALVTVPLFTGFATTYNVRKAEEDAAVAKAQADGLEQMVILQVWQSYYAFKTATQLVRTSRDLLASAEQSERVALGRYKEGVGTIIDLLTAQTALAGARAQEIQARSGWYVALAQLAHDTGTAAPLDQQIAITKEGEKP